MQAFDASNRMAHVYSLAVFETIIKYIGSRYLPLFDALHLFGLERY